ncbi:MAG: TIR domain-containing protein [Rubrivivax sp.]|nr:MAG: TIR domain-containing protein [Rubrivivax sp.]
MATFFTFYSFKGGVGRSMAMANVADVLARRGLRVLAIDFDLEAPGLERYFQVEKSAALANLGLIDLLQSFKKSLSGAAPLDDAAEFRDLQRFIFPVFQQPLPNGGNLHLMTAGRREPASHYAQYALAVRTFDWQDFYFNWEGEAFFDWLRGELAQTVGQRPAYDVVLVDSRTGVTEMGGVCAYQLADVIVMLCAANHQNVEGTRAVAQDFRSDTVSALRRGRPLEMVVLPARIEQRDASLLEAFQARFRSFFGDEEPAAFREAGLSFSDLTIPYQPEYAFEEVVVSDPERREARRAIGGAFELMADALTLLAGTANDERLGAQRSAAMAAVQAAVAASGRPRGEAAPSSSAASRPESVAAASTQFDPTRRFAGYDVFLSFCQADNEAVTALAAALTHAGHTVFKDTSAYTPGDQMAESIAQALHHSRLLLVCAGREGIAPWQRREIELARTSSHSIRLVPVLLQGADGDIFSLSLRGVADVQAVDLRTWPSDPAGLQALLQLLREGTAPRRDERPAEQQANAVNPYAGVASYDEARVHLLDLPQPVLAALNSRLEDGGLAFLVGPSGVGKGSLVAALIAQLRQAALAKGGAFRVLRASPCEDPTLAILQTPPADGDVLVLDELDRLPDALRDAGSQSLWPAALTQRIADASITRPVLLVGNDLPLLSWRTPPSPDAALWTRLQAVSVALTALDTDAIRRAIEAPAARSGFAFEPGLLDRIVQDAGSSPGALRLAQLALAQLWSKASRGFLTNAAYDACGGVAGQHAAHIDARLGELPARLTVAAHALLLRLAVVGDDHGIGWQGAVWEQVCSQPTLVDSGAEALLWLLNARVVTVWRADPDHLWFSLLQPLAPGQCGRLEPLLGAENAHLLRRQRVVASLAAWRERRETPDALLNGYRLEEASALLQDWASHLSDEEQRFIARSQAHSRRRSRIRTAVLATCGLAAVLAALGWWMYSTKNAALDQANNAIKIVLEQGAKTTSKAYELDASEFGNLRIFIQYKDARDQDVVNTLSTAMRAYGLRVEPAGLVTQANTCGDVRFFSAGDRERAAKLQQATAQLLESLGVNFSPELGDLSQGALAKDGTGTLELWLPSLRTLSNTAPPATNAKDGAPLRPVPGACATVGSSPAQVKGLMQQLGQPYLDLYANDLPLKRLWVDGFQIYQFEVTNEEFEQYRDACPSGPACPVGWKTADKPREPARYLTWLQADGYCRWAGGRLPSEIEWEKAARGTSGNVWPWGDVPDANRFQGRANGGGKVLAEVGSFPAGNSPYGVADMAGNVWEMTSSVWPGAGGHVMKGGSYLNPLPQVRSAWRWVHGSEARGDDSLGFRCVVDLPSSPRAAAAR